jgi:26S proteasome non-ATPase regulatory subunit 10
LKLKIYFYSKSNRSCIHWACAGGHDDILDYLFFEYKVKLDQPDEQGWTPLIIASSAGHLSLVKKLVAHKCDVNAQNDNGQTSLHYAASKNHFDVAKHLLENGADVNLCDNYGHTPLHRAASKGFLKIANLFIGDFKAHVNVADCLGNTPL